jgi:hypothetical protein
MKATVGGPRSGTLGAGQPERALVKRAYEFRNIGRTLLPETTTARRAVTRTDAQSTARLRQLPVMWGKVVQEVRRLGPRKIAIFAIAAAIAVVLAYGDNSSNDAASGRTLPRAMVISAQHAHVDAHLRP